MKTTDDIVTLEGMKTGQIRWNSNTLAAIAIRHGIVRRGDERDDWFIDRVLETLKK